MRVKGWDKFQHYKDRAPPWIKLYRGLLDDPDWHELDGEAAKALVMIWLIASEAEGELPDARKLAFRLRISEAATKQILIKLSHWLAQDASASLAECNTETETETETEEEVVSEASASDARPSEKGKARKRPEYTELFLTFWRGYPTDPNMSKKEAFDAWRRLSPEDHTSAIASLPSFKAFCAKDPTYRPIHACRYLTKRRFEGHLSDDLTPEERADIAVASERGAAKLGYVKIGARWVKQEESAA